jgi:hypothetical protein
VFGKSVWRRLGGRSRGRRGVGGSWDGWAAGTLGACAWAAPSVPSSAAWSSRYGRVLSNVLRRPESCLTSAASSRALPRSARPAAPIRVAHQCPLAGGLTSAGQGLGFEDPRTSPGSRERSWSGDDAAAAKAEGDSGPLYDEDDVGASIHSTWLLTGLEFPRQELLPEVWLMGPGFHDLIVLERDEVGRRSDLQFTRMPPDEVHDLARREHVMRPQRGMTACLGPGVEDLAHLFQAEPFDLVGHSRQKGSE